MANTPDIIEKRVKPTVIRRRARVEPPPTPPPAETAGKKKALEKAAPANGAQAAEKAAPSPAAPHPVVGLAPEAAPEGRPVPREEGAKGLPRPPPGGPPPQVATTLEKKGTEVEETAKAKAVKKPSKRLTKDDIEEALIQRVGGLKKVAQIADSGITRLERVFQPDRLARGKKKLIGRRLFKKTEVTVPKASKRLIRIEEGISVGELAHRMGLKGGDLVKKLMDMGQMVTINQVIDHETAAIVAHDFSFEIENVLVTEDQLFGAVGEIAANLKPRPPVVTVMGHVDHGKTTLLDAIRSANVAQGEAGGITQHIGAYSVSTPKGDITFVDTPGHEAFTAMRARGAKATDIVVLVVAADDGVMPQTLEAIDHAQAAKVPIIVAVNKMDKPEANLDRIKRTLAEKGLAPEEWGGHTLYCPVSAKERRGIESLLEQIALQAEMLELKANPTVRAEGIVLEAELDRGRGPVATLLVQKGTLEVGHIVVAGLYYGKVRRLLNDRGEMVKEALPSRAVEMIGLAGVPQAGDHFRVAPSEDDAREVAERRQSQARVTRAAQGGKLSLEQFYEQVQGGETKELRLVLKTDVQGSVEPIRSALLKLSTPEVKVIVVHAAVGGITESDINLAVASRSIVIGFNVRPDEKGRAAADTFSVDIRGYAIIYELLDDVRKAMGGLLAPIEQEVYLGRALVKQLFTVSKVGNVAGCEVIDGKITRAGRIRLLRDGAVVYTGKLGTLKRFKDDAREVAKGFECGLSIENYQDLKTGDMIEAFLVEEVARTLSAPG